MAQDSSVDYKESPPNKNEHIGDKVSPQAVVNAERSR